MTDKLTHINESGNAEMVDVSIKKSTYRTASAAGWVKLTPEIFEAVKANNIKKGDVLTTAKLAGIQAAKKTWELIPLCHNIFISQIDVELKLNEVNNSIEIISVAKTEGKTGIEMEALTAVSAAALTIYDMCKAMSKSMEIGGIMLFSKTGGKSGDYLKQN